MLVRVVWLLLVVGCIEKKSANSLPLLSLLKQKEPAIPAYSSNKNWNGCVLDFKDGEKKYTICILAPPESCNRTMLINLKDGTVLQNRKDDLTFLSLNYPDCATSTPTLFSVYNALNSPASFALKIKADLNTINENQFRISFRESCDFISTSLNPLTHEELSKLNRVETELAVLSSTSSACINSLELSRENLELVNSVRSNAKSLLSICSHSSGSVDLCNW